jgi:hypothetical protein
VDILVALVGSGGVVTLVTVLLQHRQKMKELELQKKKSEETITRIVNKEIPLEYHPLFTTIDEIEHFFMRSFQLPDEGRTTIIREMCVNKLRVWREVLKKHAVNAQNCYDACQLEGSCNKSENLLSHMLIEGLERYATSWDKSGKMDVFGKRDYDAESLATMRIFIPIFQDWHRSREEVVRIASHEIPNSGMNATCHGDWWDVLAVYQYAFIQMKYDALSAMSVLNGGLTGKKFLGITVGDLPH